MVYELLHGACCWRCLESQAFPFEAEGFILDHRWHDALCFQCIRDSVVRQLCVAHHQANSIFGESCSTVVDMMSCRLVIAGICMQSYTRWREAIERAVDGHAVDIANMLP